ncbi:hypothetical protein MJO29_003282 [Puccinia striiformis f. sp. tritici]|uniref:Anaphase-promoting complex subunit 4 WD40 domain-containing protein n=2 Tax=Puccinia striiformis TaxID=27350 RepID=A0A0L0UZ52_9BASI|nr:hypothetical protein Pst134EA_004871 [Puccinia striiformis f. sp. tritici]KAI9621289.1 hypothetical protein H4Q26_015787 [Puccinia striiformis f. sp. tritici PST-130]KNE92009.1 hypothetical protein PSTG_14597 [Puccinia striiformis f. sp. tritici PST-78]KAH9462037.1 hypothetical protein Pst134EB_005954 [Puccinia striiformis f. sp. tritici]KAH9470961.1 hypothetical protein Pst134EA_004871 [Puccinia striiformis f. sp. tritici]KAI7933339.1 hypothetical protein MJO29_016901 [Puccinia striiformis
MTSKDGKEIELSHPEDAITAVKFDPANPNLLLVSSWDKTVKLYNLSNPSPTEPISVYPHPSPVLDVCFGTGKNAGRGYTASLDRGVREIDLESTSASPTSNSRPNRVISTHQDAVKCVHYSSEFDILISGSWDRSVVLQDPKSSSNKQYPNQICSLTLPNLPAKVFCLDASKDKLVVAMGNRRIWIWDLLKLSESVQKVNDQFNSNPNLATTETVVPPPPLQERESSLKFMTRAIKCMPRGDGYASGSIEGRVAVDLFDTSTESQAKKYAFKCHRQVIDGVDTIYPVNALAFHPTFGTFATGGGDGIVSIWDSAAKKRLRQLPKYPGSITSLAFNSDGSKLAIACSILEEENPANNPNNNETDHSSDPNNKKESSDEDMKDSSAAPAAAGDPDKKIDSHINSLKNCVFIRNVIDDCKPRTK